ncbi:MAG: hypothetical protein V4654_01790 [Bdellovibrionota bacterium]
MFKFILKRKNTFALYALAILISAGNTSSAYAANQCSSLFANRNAVSWMKSLNLQSYVENYAQIIPAVQNMITLGLENFAGKPPRGYAYRAVKKLLIESELVKRSIDGTFASSAHSKSFLKNRGFINLLELAPFNKKIKGAFDDAIPDGAILVYAGTNGADGTLRPLGEGIGHIEIKCGRNCYMYDTVKEHPGANANFHTENTFISGEGFEQRQLIGVYILDYFSLF